MRVFVGGGSGAIGVPSVRALRARGHDVTAMTRSPEKVRALESLGAEVAVVDALDGSALEKALAKARPEVVVDLLTALPKGGPRRLADLRATNRLRTEGTRNLLAAAEAAGARRYVAESFYSVYGYAIHETELTEDAPVATEPDEAQRALLTKERMVLDAPLETVVLRFAAFYGPGAGTRELAGQLRRRMLPSVRGRGVSPWVHVDDAARAVAAAVERGQGVYNVAGDSPLALDRFLRTLAAAAGAPAPWRAPGFVLAMAAPYLKVVLIDSSFSLSNARAKADLGWSPRFASVADGLAAGL